MRVALISNWHEQCGNAGYARDLCKELEKEFEVTKYDDPMKATEGSVALVSWHPSRVQLPPAAVHELHHRGMKVIVILQNSFEGYYHATDQDPLLYADAITAHQMMGGNVNITYIPHGIPIIDELREPGPELRIGVAGFPYLWKRFDMAAAAAHQAGGRSLLIAPMHDMGDVMTPIQDIQRTYSTADVVREWLPIEEVVRRLSTCTINICWYQHMPGDDLAGQSGSVRMAIASRRPIIVSDHPKLASVRAYTDDVYLALTPEEVHATVKEIWERIQKGEPVKRPNRIMKELGWDKTGLMYRELIRKVAA